MSPATAFLYYHSLHALSTLFSKNYRQKNIGFPCEIIAKIKRFIMRLFKRKQENFRRSLCNLCISLIDISVNENFIDLFYVILQRVKIVQMYVFKTHEF